jgi:hypothetical protein
MTISTKILQFAGFFQVGTGRFMCGGEGAARQWNTDWTDEADWHGSAMRNELSLGLEPRRAELGYESRMVCLRRDAGASLRAAPRA